MRKAKKYRFSLSPRLLRSRRNSARSRQRGKKESEGGATYPQQSPRESAAAGQERRLCLRSRRRARPGGSQPPRAASSRGRPDSPACHSGAGSSPSPGRPALGRSRGSAPSRAPPPAPGPHLLQRRARGAGPRAAALPVRPAPPAHSLRAAALRGPGAERARCRRAFPGPVPWESPHLRAPASSEWSPRLR